MTFKGGTIFPLGRPAWRIGSICFGHIFAGGYGAGYYSYKWAEVLSADAYGLFEEHGVLDPGSGERFRDEVLAVGGSRPALESFKAFRGREPSVDALLRHIVDEDWDAVAWRALANLQRKIEAGWQKEGDR